LKEKRMNLRITAWLALSTLLFSVLWLVFLIASMATAGPLDTFERVLAYAARQDALFTLTYINAALVTFSATALMAALYPIARVHMPLGARIGLAFLPVYCGFNLFAYLSQLTVVPALLPAAQQPETAAAARLLLSQLIQQWPGSGVSFFNNLGYAVLAIPSILFGLALRRKSGPPARHLRTGGLLLALNGIACILGVLGILAGSPLLSNGSLLGGVLFIAALPFLTAGFLRWPAGDLPLH
jgi:hypothetical protein